MSRVVAMVAMCDWNCVKRVVQVERISQPALESYIDTLQTNSNELLVLIAEDNLQKTNFLFQALADGLNLATAYSIKRTYGTSVADLLYLRSTVLSVHYIAHCNHFWDVCCMCYSFQSTVMAARLTHLRRYSSAYVCAGVYCNIDVIHCDCSCMMIHHTCTIRYDAAEWRWRIGLVDVGGISEGARWACQAASADAEDARLDDCVHHVSRPAGRQHHSAYHITAIGNHQERPGTLTSISKPPWRTRTQCMNETGNNNDNNNNKWSK